MKFRYLLAALALTTAATDSMAGPWRRRAQPVYQSQPAYQPAYQPVYQTPTSMPSSATTDGGYVSYYTPSVLTEASTPVVDAAGNSAFDGLDEVNAKRAARGLAPFIRDESLTQAARACAAYRASYGLFGHTSNDFAFVPAGSSASSTGCAAYPASYGWMSCCTYDGYTYAGAAWVAGRDGKRYMHLYVR
jgi:uncharacterized protein YkwD